MTRRRLITRHPSTHAQRTPTRVSVEMDDEMPIGSLVSTLATRFGYPLLDHFGSPIPSRFCSVSGGKPLPPTGRLAETHGSSGGRFVQEAEAAHHGTVLMRQGPPSPPRCSRRSLLTVGGSFALVSLLGLGAGMTTALARRALSRQTADVPSPVGRPAIPSLSLRTIFPRHQHTVRTVAWSPDGTMLASGGNDALVFIWRPDGAVLHALQFNGPVRTLAWSPDGMQLAVGALNTVSFVDAHVATLLAANAQQHVAPVTALGWTQTAVPLAISASEDKEAVVWNGQTHLPQVIFQRHSTPIEALTTLSNVVATASEGGVVRVWNALDGQEIHGFFSQTPQALRAAAFSPRGLLAVGGDDGTVRLWTDGRSCAQQARLAFGVQCVDAPHQLRGHTQPVRAIAYSPDGTRLATGEDDGSLILWSIESLTPIISQSLPQAITALAWSASGLAAATGQQVMVWQVHR